MGQQVAAIVYGVVCHDITLLRDDDGDWLEGKPDVDLETGDNDFQCIGLALAVQNVPENDELELPEGPLSALSQLLEENIALAKNRWKEVVGWAKTHKVVLERPQLLLVMIERA